MAAADEATAQGLIDELDPFADATTLYVFADGSPFATFVQTQAAQQPAAIQQAAALIPGKFQSQGQGAHAEGKFLAQLAQFQQLVPAGTNLLLQINKTPCGTCVQNAILAMKQAFPRLNFRIEMLGLYPGNVGNPATTPDHLKTMRDAGVDLQTLDLQPLITKVRSILSAKLDTAIQGNLDRDGYRAEVRYWKRKLGSYRNGLRDSVAKLDARGGETPYGQNLPGAVLALDTQITYLDDSWNKWGGKINAVVTWYTTWATARGDYPRFDPEANCVYIEQQLARLAAERAAIVAGLPDAGFVTRLNEWLDWIRDEFQNDLLSNQNRKRAPSPEPSGGGRGDHDDDPQPPDRKKKRSAPADAAGGAAPPVLAAT